MIHYLQIGSTEMTWQGSFGLGCEFSSYSTAKSLTVSAGVRPRMIPFFADPNFMRSPSPTFTLPPDAAAHASYLALQVSPENQAEEFKRRPKASIYVDSEAVESTSGGDNTLDITNSDSSGYSSLSS